MWYSMTTMVGRSGRSSSPVVGQRTDYEPEFCEWCAGCCRAEPGKQQKYYPAVVVDNDEEYSMKWLFCCTTTGLGAAGCSGYERRRFGSDVGCLFWQKAAPARELKKKKPWWCGMACQKAAAAPRCSARYDVSLRPPQPTTTRYM